jgi:pseudaminic acid synthase
MMSIQIANFQIGINRRPFIVAEMSANHKGSLNRALQLVDAAADAGVHALKLQTYTADTMTLNISEGEFFIHNPDSLWHGRSLYNLYKEAATPWEWHKPIFERCYERGIVAFSTPFDASAVDFLETLDVPVYKIAGFENADLPLIRKVAATGKPMIISTGMATLAELDETVREARIAGCENLILLKCTSTYPASPEESNLRTIPHMRQLFNVEMGLSDHTLGIGVALASVAMGATVIEKHFTLSRSDGAVDSAFSMEPGEMEQLVIESERAWQSLGQVNYGATEKEKDSLAHRRSLYVVEDVAAGEQFTEKNIRSIRPSNGLAPKYLDVVIGKRAARDLKKGAPLSWSEIGE